MMATKPMGERTKAVWRQQLMAIIVNIGTMTLGLGLGFPTVTLGQLTDTEEPVSLNQSQASWYASFNLLVAPFGGLFCGYVLDKIGRKKCLYVMNSIVVVSWTNMALVSETSSSTAYYQLLFSRFLIGLGSGFAGMPAGVYSAEISVPNTRARLIMCAPIAVSAGMTLIYFVGYMVPRNFRLVAMVLICFQSFALFCIVPIPETPSWLISKGRLDEAKQSMNYFRGVSKNSTETYEEIEAEFNLLQKSIQKQAGERKPTLMEIIHLPEVYKPLIIMMTLCACCQLSGVFVVVVYAVQITTEAGVQIDPFLCAVFIGLARLITTCFLGWLYNIWGRRQAGIVSASGMTICMWTLASYQHTPFGKIPHLPVIAIVSFIFLSTIGLYTLPFFMNAEVYPQRARGLCVGTTASFGLLLGFTVVKTYPSIKMAIGTDACFALFGLNSFLSIFFVYFFLPETKGYTLLEIEERFRGRTNT